jgi:hypothetical protein
VKVLPREIFLEARKWNIFCFYIQIADYNRDCLLIFPASFGRGFGAREYIQENIFETTFWMFMLPLVMPYDCCCLI